MNHALSGLCLAACLLTGVAQAQTQTTKLVDMQAWGSQGWRDLGRVHVRDSAEKDLAFLSDGNDVVQIRLCAERNAVRLRNAELWMAGDKRQKLWLPLVLGANKCTDSIKVQGGPIRVTHLALEYEAMSLGTEGAHLSVYGKSAKPR
jgi:hypothetical protein